MTADRAGRGSPRPMRLAERATGEAFIASPEAFTSSDCPEARMAGGNHHHHHNNNRRR
ncbi:MAG TPA: hypothetical protein VHZ26_13705 [Caulobacteraceae bacterium]|nr:hypothetical protein [Caulobacteraceae bacterium]